MKVISTLRTTFQEFSDDRGPRMAAALAYYTAFSLAPLLIVVITIAGLIWDPSDIQGAVQSQVESLVGKDGAKQVETMLSSASDQGRGLGSKILSAVLLVLGATGVVGQLQSAMNDAWEVKPDPEQGGMKNFLAKRFLSFGMICGIAFLLLVSLVLSSMLSAAGGFIAGMLPADVSKTVLHAVNLSVSLIVIAVLFAAMFKYLPDADVRWSDVAAGALLTALLFVVGKFAIGAYLGSKNMDDAYGAAGSLALVMVWIYYSAMIFLFGAEFTQVWAKQHGSGIQPAEGAVRVVQKTADTADADVGATDSSPRAT